MLNNDNPRCILANDSYCSDYALDLAKWQYRTGTGFLMTANNKSNNLEDIVS